MNDEIERLGRKRKKLLGELREVNVRLEAAIRKARGATVRELANLSGLSKTWIAHLRRKK